MTLDTQDYRSIAAALQALLSGAAFNNPILNSRHASIQNQIRALASFFTRLADLAEGCENSLTGAPPIVIANTPGGSVSFKTTGSAASLLRGKTASAIVSASYAAGATSSLWEWNGLYASFSGDSFSLGASATASFRLLNGKKFDPRLELGVEGQGHLFGAEGSVGYEIGIFEASVKGAGEIGAVYGEGKAVLSMEEVVLSAQAGAALARGECVMAIELADLKLIVTLSGSLGSVEAGASWESSSNATEVSVSAGLIAGAGIRVRLEH